MQTKNYNDFWQKIHNSAKENGFPLRVMFELTYRCNFGCGHCYVPQNYRKHKEELKTKKIFSILDQLAEIGCLYLGFTGGEPFIREDILDIVRYAKRKGFEVILYTNGSLINEKIADELANLRLNKVDITIPAMTEGVFEQITQVPGSHKKVFRAIRLLKKKRVNLGFKTCVLKGNENEIKDIQKFVASLGAPHRLDDMLSARLDGAGEPYEHRGRLLDEVNIRKCSGEDISVNSRAISENSRLFKCGVGLSQAAITPSGELKMCLMINYPKYYILESSLKDCWQKLKKLVKNIKPDEGFHCLQCKLAPFCKWCPAKAWLYNRTFTSCEPEVRAFAETNKKSVERIQLAATEVKV